MCVIKGKMNSKRLTADSNTQEEYPFNFLILSIVILFICGNIHIILISSFLCEILIMKRERERENRIITNPPRSCRIHSPTGDQAATSTRRDVVNATPGSEMFNGVQATPYKRF